MSENQKSMPSLSKTITEVAENLKRIKVPDPIDNPGHYTFGTIEVIDYIRDKMTPEMFQGHCMANVIKYVSRHKHKNGVEDLRKAQVYLNWLIESEEQHGG